MPVGGKINKEKKCNNVKDFVSGLSEMFTMNKTLSFLNNTAFFI